MPPLPLSLLPSWLCLPIFASLFLLPRRHRTRRAFIASWLDTSNPRHADSRLGPLGVSADTSPPTALLSGAGPSELASRSRAILSSGALGPAGAFSVRALPEARFQGDCRERHCWHPRPVHAGNATSEALACSVPDGGPVRGQRAPSLVFWARHPLSLTELGVSPASVAAAPLLSATTFRLSSAALAGGLASTLFSAAPAGGLASTPFSASPAGTIASASSSSPIASTGMVVSAAVSAATPPSAEADVSSPPGSLSSLPELCSSGETSPAAGLAVSASAPPFEPPPPPPFSLAVEIPPSAPSSPESASPQLRPGPHRPRLRLPPAGATASPTFTSIPSSISSSRSWDTFSSTSTRATSASSSCPAVSTAPPPPPLKTGRCPLIIFY